MFFSSKIFATAGVTDALLASMVMGFVIVLATAASVSIVNRWGRKYMLLRALIVVVLSLVVMATALMFMSNPGMLAVIAMLVYQAGFNLGPGSLPYVPQC